MKKSYLFLLLLSLFLGISRPAIAVVAYNYAENTASIQPIEKKKSIFHKKIAKKPLSAKQKRILGGVLVGISNFIAPTLLPFIWEITFLTVITFIVLAGSLVYGNILLNKGLDKKQSLKALLIFLLGFGISLLSLSLIAQNGTSDEAIRVVIIGMIEVGIAIVNFLIFAFRFIRKR